MYLKRIRIENYKSLQNEVINFTHHTLFVGANDHGKTNILKAINDMFNLQISDKGELLDKDFYKRNKRRGAGSSALRLSFLIADLPKGLRHTVKKHTEISVSLRFYANSDVKFSINDSSLSKNTAKHNKKALDKYLELRQKINVCYIPTFKNIESELSSSSNSSIFFKLLTDYLANATKRGHGGKTSEYRKIKQSKESIDDLLKESFVDIKATAAKYLPKTYGTGNFILKFLKSDSDDKRDLELSHLISGATHIIDSKSRDGIGDVGSGIQQAVTIGLIEKSCILKNKSNIILFEEPESFLHPNAQREVYIKLSQLSKRPATQLIFTTHSAAILDSTNIANIAVVRKTPANVPYEDRHTSILQISDVKKINLPKFLDEIEIRRTFENSEVFFSELVLFVEGFSDELVIKEAIKKIAPELLYRVSIIGCEGNTKFSVWTKFLDHFKNGNGQQIEWVVATDKDTLLSDVVDDFKEFRMADSIKWDEIVKFVREKKFAKNEDGQINRNSAKLLAGKINKELNKCGVYVFEADIEFALIAETSIARTRQVIKEFDSRGEATLKHFSTLDRVANLIGSKGPNLEWTLETDNRKKWKKASLHKAIASSLKPNEFSQEIYRLIKFLKDKINLK